jgi:uncharacterized protein YjiS (DUF1127 family)
MRPVVRRLSAVQFWLARRRTRQHLKQLDARLLADVGMTRADQARECRKPPWR